MDLIAYEKTKALEKIDGFCCLRSYLYAAFFSLVNWPKCLSRADLCHQYRGSEFPSYKFELRNWVTQNEVILRVTNSKTFIQIVL